MMMGLAEEGSRAQRARSHPEGDKLGRLRPAGDIEALGVRLMAEAEAAFTGASSAARCISATAS